MGHADTDHDDAATRLHHLQTYYSEHPVTGPAGHSYISSEPRPTVVAPGAPLSLGTLDHVTATVTELADATRAINPAAGPVPATAAAVYDWCHQNTEHAPDTDRQRLETIEYRQYLEHAIRAGDHTIVCRHRCPKCRTWGLMWQTDMQRALCTNGKRCVDRNGMSHTFTLARLAFEHIAARKECRTASAT